MRNNAQSVEKAYEQRNSLIILGLTGRTGSGCSTVAKILNENSFDNLNLHDPKTFDYQSRDERKYEVIYQFMSNNRWKPFTIIEGSSIIFSFIIESGFKAFKDYFAQYKSINENNKIRVSAFKDLSQAIDGMKYMFDDAELCNLGNIDNILLSPEKINKYYQFYLNDLPIIKKEFYEAISDFTCHKEYVDKFSQTKYVKSHLYTFFMQEIANNIRCSGNPYSNVYTENNFYDVAKRMDAIIRIIQKHNENEGIVETRICIDAIRNSYEAYYFKDYYSSFYLISINTEDNYRKIRLGNLDDEELNSIDDIEYAQNFKDDYEIFFHQNMQECLAMSDIHFYNPQSNDGKYFFLTEQIIKYISLMLHPELVNPTHIERCMQTAYIAKLNSGCLSRQVGAVITGEDFSIKAIGWNEVPEGQTACNLRCIPNYCANKDEETYSSYELQNPDFQNALMAINKLVETCDLRGRCYSYCFKDIYNGIKKDKNQVFTRALHAEENAFLQLSKNGGQGIKGGKLFTTASPCELCAKKAYQLGIKHIYYIDPYPGISIQHILNFGKNHNPETHLFYGAIGSAYMSLYTPRMPIKDELKLLTGINCKNVLKYIEGGIDHSIGVKDIKYINQRNRFIFQSRTNIRAIEQVEIEALRDGITHIPQNIYWTGSSYDGLKITSCDREYSVEVIQDEKSPYTSRLNFTEALHKGDHVKYECNISVKDSRRIMSPYYAQLVTIHTDHLSVEVQAPKGLIECVSSVVYADTNMSVELEVERHTIEPSNENDDEVYIFDIDHPNLMYSYCIEWRFKEE